MIVYGPVPSRRLGRSLGINHVPPKTCTYSCTYCQVGRTRELTLERTAFHEPLDVAVEVEQRLEELRERGDPVDYLAFVPDGEPTLDLHLGEELTLLARTGLRTAVITNASLLNRTGVREELARASWVSLKVDAVDTPTWRRLDRPHHRLDLAAILEGALAFRDTFGGFLATETMLVDGVNDSREHAERMAAYLHRLQPRCAYLSVPTRPPTSTRVRPSSPEAITRFHAVLRDAVEDVQLLIGYEGNVFSTSGDPAPGLLAIVAVHPMRRAAVERYLERSGASWSLVEELLERELLVRVDYEGHEFYLGRPKVSASV